MQYKLDNEFELVFVVAFQKILQLSYIDKFLSDIHLEFRDKYKNDLKGMNRNFGNYDFSEDYRRLLQEAEEWGKLLKNFERDIINNIHSNSRSLSIQASKTNEILWGISQIQENCCFND